jgi:arsenate reductase (glutaredoxin)
MKKNKLVMWHKSTCSKSCEVMQALKKAGVKPEVYEYLEESPTEEMLIDVLEKLGMKAEDLVRKKERIYREKFEGEKLTEEQWLKILVKYPLLIERPILIKGNKAIIARPTERIKEII